MVKTCKIAAFVAISLYLVACSDSGPKISVDALPEFVQQHGDTFVIGQNAGAAMVVAPQIGGRIASLKYDKHEILMTEERLDCMLWGSALWSSPQSEWSWPPIDTLDSKPYKVSVENNFLVATSDIDKKTGYQFVKRYGVNPAHKNSFIIRYSIHNFSDATKSVSPWEVTRFPPRGIVLFPATGKQQSNGIFYPLELKNRNNVSWFEYAIKHNRDEHYKIISDGEEGWVAYSDSGYLLVITFEDVPAELIPADEGEIALFANMDKTYLELEHLGSMTTLQPGEHLDWEVVWYLTKLPDNISVEIGNQELVNFIRELIVMR